MADAAGAAGNEASSARTKLEKLRGLLERGRLRASGRLLTDIHPARAAGLLESLPPKERSVARNMVETDVAGPILKHLHDEVRMYLALDMEPEDLAATAGTLEQDDLVDLIQDLPTVKKARLLRDMDEHERTRVESMLTYEEDSAGGLMNIDQITVRAVWLGANLITAFLAAWVIGLFEGTLDKVMALAGGVLLTTVTDVVGFLAFLGLATMVLL